MLTKETFLAQFADATKRPVLSLANVPVIGTPKEFSTGSLGFNFNGKVPVLLPNGELVQCQFSGNATIIGSNPNKPKKGKKGEAQPDTAS